MNLSHGDSRVLNMWQRLYFDAESSKSPSDEADAWRRLLIQLRTSRKSNKISYHLYTRLLQRLVTNYCQVVDNQGVDQGLNNYAETILTIASGCRNESQNWSSGLSLDGVARALGHNREQRTQSAMSEPLCSVETNILPEQTSVIRENKEDSNKVPIAEVKCNNNLVSPIAHSGAQLNGVTSIEKHTQDSASVKMPSINIDNKTQSEDAGGNVVIPGSESVGGIKVESTKLVPDCQNSRFKVNSGVKRKATSPCSDGGRISPVLGHLNPGQRIYPHGAFSKTGSTFCATDISPEVHNTTFQRNQLPRSSIHFEGCADKLSRKTSGKQNCAEVVEQDKNALSDFITAKQQLIINSKKKNYHHESDFGVSRQSAINNASYGSTRKTLGTRRGPSRQFVPPVLNPSHDEGLERGSKSDSRANNDLEVDERLKNIEPKMIELITNEIMDHGPPVSWDDIAGLEFAKNVIKEIVVWPMLRPDIFKGLRGPPKGVLLFGPPGTGKTLIGKCIASQSKATFFSISASSLTSKWVGEGEKMVRALFAVARCHLPAVIFIDEIDSLLSQRTDGEHDSSRRIKTEFLVQLDGATTNSDDRILVVGATNRPQEIDEAARRRLVKRLYIPLPDAGAREQIMHSLLSQQKCSLSEQEIKHIVQRTHGYSGSDMANLCREAALGPIRSITDIQCIDADQVPPILFKDFDAALHQVRASVSEKDLDLYTQWNTLYGSGTK